MELTELVNMKAGTVLQKGKRKRIFISLEGFYVYYKLPSSKNKTTGEHITVFSDWLRDAQVSNIDEVKVLNLADVTSDQFKKMHHALGLPRKTKPYRNYYNCSADNADWNDLVEKGFAIRGQVYGENKTNYFVTFEATKLIYGKRMSKKFYDEL